MSQTGFSGQNATITTTNDSYTSGTSATYTIQSALENGKTYYIRAYGIDPEGTNTWGNVATARSFRTEFLPGTGEILFNTQTAFSGATYNRVKDEGTNDLSPHLTTTYHELAADINTVGLWHMNEASGNAVDSSGNGNTEHRREQLLLRGSLEMGETLPEDLQNILMLVVALLLK